MNISEYTQLNGGMRSFITVGEFPIGSNTFNKSDARKSIVNKTSASNAALEVMDLGWFVAGTCISFCCDVKVTSQTTGAPSISIDSRTGSGLSSGRKIVNTATSNSTEWESVRCDWIVSEFDNWITLSYGASTTSIGVFEFRNPRLAITNAQHNNIIILSLLRSSGVWSIDTGTFISSGGKLLSASGDSIIISWPYINNIRAPIVHTTTDTGASLSTAGFISCGPHTITNSGCSIRLIKSDGSFVGDVNSGGTVRIHVSVIS